MTMDDLIPEGEEAPKWDEALASLVVDEYKRLGNGLKLEDFIRLASDHSIRFDDIMDTVFRMSIDGALSYCDQNGDAVQVTKSMVDDLYVNGRLHAKDMTDFDGTWAPAGKAKK